jgi:hypothetical protein
MNIYFIVAAGLALILGLVHSILGELLIFRKFTKDYLPVLVVSKDLVQRTLRATWHIPSVLAAGLSAILLRLSLPLSTSIPLEFIERAMVLSFFASTLILVLLTKGKHPGWIVLLSITIFIYLGSK